MCLVMAAVIYSNREPVVIVNATWDLFQFQLELEIQEREVSFVFVCSQTDSD